MTTLGQVIARRSLQEKKSVWELMNKKKATFNTMSITLQVKPI